MGRIIHSDLLQCSSCGEIFVASPKEFDIHDFLVRSIHDDTARCQRCTNQIRQIGDTFQSILMYCKNRINGCRKELPSSDLASHEVTCEYRPVRCIWHLQCEQKEISFCNYRHHLETMHKPYIKKVHLNEEYNVTLKDLKNHVVSASYAVCDEKNHVYFLRKCLIDLSKDLFMVCVHYIGNNEDAKKYMYRVKINQGIESMHTVYQYFAYCAPCVETPNSTDSHSHCIVLHPKKLFLTEDYLDELKYTVTIKRVKEHTESQ
ncbi:hypothetical protein RUM43_001092 [Polyplax serrata]|uniref:SIAH-type domain-containing protein n=1 Tax=Polyplax serrata TaxID=468196 RepID=A0AAN8SED2_POLSC